MITGTDVVKYSAVARVLHWAIAISIIVNIALALGHDALEGVFAAMPVHKAIGITVLVLSILRLLWRLGHTPPALPHHMPFWQRRLAHGLHWLFYFMIIAVPLSGWIMSSAGTHPLNWFGLFDIPKLPVNKGSFAAEVAHEGHEIIGLLYIPLIALHVGAALYHHFVRGDQVLRRML